MPAQKPFCLICGLALTLALVPIQARATKAPIQILQDQDPTLAKCFGEPLTAIDDIIVVGDDFAGKIYLFEGMAASSGFGKLIAEIPAPEDGLKGFGKILIPMDKGLIVQAVKPTQVDDGQGGLSTVDQWVNYYFDLDRASPTFGRQLNVMPLAAELLNPTAQAFMSTSLLSNGTNLALSRFDLKEVVNETTRYVDKLDIIDGNPASPTYGQSLLSMDYPMDTDSPEVGAVAYVGNILVLYSVFISDQWAVDLYYYDVDPGSPTFGQELTRLHWDQKISLFEELSSYDPIHKRLLTLLTIRPNTREIYVLDLDPASATFGEVLTTFPLTNSFTGWAMPTIKALDNKLFISDPGYDGTQPDSGAIYVYDNDPASATYGQQIHIIENPTPATADFTFDADQFGASLAIAGGNIVTSAIFDDTAGLDAGAVYVFSGDDYALKSTIHSPHHETSRFGQTVCTAGNFLAVGLPMKDGQSVNEGAVQLYNPVSGALVKTLENPDHLSNDLFGEVMASDDRLLAIKSTFDTTGLTHAGRVHLFDIDPASATFGQRLAVIDRPVSDFDAYGHRVETEFGASMRFGNHKLLITSPYQFQGIAMTVQAQPIGVVFIYDADPDSAQFGQIQDSIINPTIFDVSTQPEPNTHLSNALDFMGNDVLMGSIWDGDNPSGNIFVVDPELTQNRYDNEIKLQLDDPQPELKRNFGARAAVIGDVIAVTSAKTIDAASSPSVLFLFDGKIGSPTAGDLLLTLENPEPDRSENFGNQLEAREGMLIVGALNKFSPGGTPGSVYIYNADPAWIGPPARLGSSATPWLPSVRESSSAIPSPVLREANPSEPSRSMT